MFYTRGDAGRVPRRAVQDGAEPRVGHALQLVAEPVHGLRAPLHLLLRPGVRAARRPAGGLALRHSIRVKANVAEVLAPRARAAVVARRERRDRRRHRPVPAGRGPLPADARLPRGARRGREPVRDHHARADDRARHRRAGRGAARAPERLGHVLGADARRARCGAQTEPGTAPPRQRLRALSKLVEAGVKASVGMAPILPGLSDRPEQLAEVVRAAREAGACGVWANVLYLRPGTREHFLNCLGESWPELLPEYERLYASRAYLKNAQVEPVREAVRKLARAEGIRDRRRVPPVPIGPAQLDARLYDARQTPRNTIAGQVPEEITALIVDDHEVVREGLRLSLSRAPHIRVVGEASDGASAVELGAPPQAGRRDHGRSHARDGRARGDAAAHRAGARQQGADLHRLLRALAARARFRIRRQGIRPEGGAARDARPRDRKGRCRRGLRGSGADAPVPRRPRPDPRC